MSLLYFITDYLCDKNDKIYRSLTEATLTLAGIIESEPLASLESVYDYAGEDNSFVGKRRANPITGAIYPQD